MTPELKNACEKVFQHHKSSSEAINWSKDKFAGQISIGLRELAKETLVRRNVIYYPNPAKKTVTILNPAAVSAASFEEAENLVRNFVALKPVASFVAERQVKIPLKESRLVIPPPARQTARLFRITSETEPALSSGIKWYLKPIFFYGIWPACAAAVSILIAYLLGSAS